MKYRYFSDWYLMSPENRKLVVIIMSQTLEPQKLTAGKMITLSMYTFGSVSFRAFD